MTSQSGATSLEAHAHPWAQVPWRTIIGTVGVVLVTGLTVVVVFAASKLVAWVAVGGFFAVVLAPLVSRVQRRVGDRRVLATTIVVALTLSAVIGTIALFVMPVRTQLLNIITDLPGTVHDAADGKGPLGDIVQRLDVESFVQEHENELTRAAERLDAAPFERIQTIASTLFALVTITLISFMLLCQAPSLGQAALSMVPMRRRSVVRQAASEAAKAISGYMIGNLLISMIAGITAFACLAILGVPSPIVLALWVAFADLIPLVGATIGAAVCVLAAFLHSPTAGIVAAIFFVIYQQIENSIIYPVLMSRQVRVSPLGVLLSVLVAVELFGLTGALLAVPVSGALQVVGRAVRQERPRDRLVLPDDLVPRTATS